MRLFLLPIGLLILLLGIVFFKGLLQSSDNVQNSFEASIVREENRDTFYEQVKTSNGEFIENAGFPVFDNKKIADESPKYVFNTSPSQILGSHIAADGSEKWIEVDLSDQKLYGWEGNRKVYDFAISSGRPGYDTVQGEFRVWSKVRNQAYRGGSRARGDYYYLPNVPYSLFFYKGYAIHGAYWHNDFGIKRRSSGCVNLRPTDAEQVYNWAGPAMPLGVGAVRSTADNPGVRVVVHE